MDKSSNDNHHKSVNLIMLANDYGFIKKLFWGVFVVLLYQGYIINHFYMYIHSLCFLSLVIINVRS